jgi:uncharacterized protein (DUF1778 family)
MAVSKTRKTDGKFKKATAAKAISARTQPRRDAEHSRMNFRLAPRVKERVSRAAALCGQDLTEFAVTTLSEKADLVIERHDSLLLGNDEYAFFLAALGDNVVPESSDRSRAAAEKYRQGTRKGVRYVFAD